MAAIPTSRFVLATRPQHSFLITGSLIPCLLHGLLESPDHGKIADIATHTLLNNLLPSFRPPFEYSDPLTT